MKLTSVSLVNTILMLSYFIWIESNESFVIRPLAMSCVDRILPKPNPQIFYRSKPTAAIFLYQ